MNLEDELDPQATIAEAEKIVQKPNTRHDPPNHISYRLKKNYVLFKDKT